MLGIRARISLSLCASHRRCRLMPFEKQCSARVTVWNESKSFCFSLHQELLREIYIYIWGELKKGEESIGKTGIVPDGRAEKKEEKP